MMEFVLKEIDNPLNSFQKLALENKEKQLLQNRFELFENEWNLFLLLIVW